MPEEQTTDELCYWIGLTGIEGLGTGGALRLIEKFSSPEAAYMASLTELEATGLSPSVCQAVFAQKGLEEAQKEIAATAGLGCELMTLASPDYPPLLKQIPDPPIVLYVRGNRKALSSHSVAVVGSRHPTAYGLQVARRLAHDLAERKLVVVSGMARGVDSSAHRGALEAGGATVAVQGCGMDRIYPSENKSLAEQISASGAVISEFRLGTGPMPENFPIRNRIISGLSLGVIVVEASEYSGSLITARLASDQNREVFAVPGNITTAQSFGPNQLIKQGAKLVDDWTDVVQEFPLNVREQLLPPEPASEGQQGSATAGALFAESLTPEQKAVLEVLRADEPKFVDEIFTSATVPQARVLQALLELEMSGLIRQLPGKNFIRKL